MNLLHMKEYKKIKNGLNYYYLRKGDNNMFNPNLIYFEKEIENYELRKATS